MSETMSECTCEVIKTPEEYEKFCSEKYNKAAREDWEPTQRLYWLGMLSASEAMNDLFRNRWIPVTERLPKEDQEVLVSIEDLNGFDNIERTVRVGKWASELIGSSLDSYRHVWKIDGENGENCYRRVAAWMPLPEPYKENANDSV